MGVVALGHSPCPSGSTYLTNSMRITTTGTFEYGGGIDYGSMGLRAMISASPSKCYHLTRPYIAMGFPNWIILCANNQQCSYTISSSITCVPIPSTTPCLVGPVSSTVPSLTNPDRPCAGNAKAVTSNDGNQYCCGSASDVPKFGGSGYCTCGKLHSFFNAGNVSKVLRLAMRLCYCS